MLIIDFDRIHRVMQETEIIKENCCEYTNNNVAFLWNRKDDKKRGAVYSTAPRFYRCYIFISALNHIVKTAYLCSFEPLYRQSVCIDNRSRMPAVMLAGTVIFCLSYMPHDVTRCRILPYMIECRHKVR